MPKRFQWSLTVIVLAVVMVATGCTTTHFTGDGHPTMLTRSGDDSALAQPDTLETWKANPQYQNPQTLPYEELFRNADKYKGQFVHLKGEVIQVLGDPGNWNLRVNVTEKGSYGYTYYTDTVLVLSYAQNRVIEKDIIEFTGKANGVYTYESAIGASITIPSVITYETPVVGRQDN